MKATIAAFIDRMILPDYLLFVGSALLFVLLLTLALLLHRKLLLSILFVLLAFSIITLGPTLGYIKMHDYLFKHDANITEVKELEFTDALVVRGVLANHSKQNFTFCEITANVYKVAHNPVLDLLFPLNPFKKASITKENIPVGGQTEFKLFVEPFRYTKDYNVSIGASCH